MSRDHRWWNRTAAMTALAAKSAAAFVLLTLALIPSAHGGAAAGAVAGNAGAFAGVGSL